MNIVVRRAVAPREIDACLALRRAVFIEEQGVDEALEVDGLDGAARHYIALDGRQPVGTARVRLVPPWAKVQRVAVLAAHRRRGIGAALMRALTDDLRNQFAARGEAAGELDRESGRGADGTAATGSGATTGSGAATGSGAGAGARKHPPAIIGITLGAQETAIPFYAALGYAPHGAPFMDAGIPHREMRLPLHAASVRESSVR